MRALSPRLPDSTVWNAPVFLLGVLSLLLIEKLRKMTRRRLQVALGVIPVVVYLRHRRQNRRKRRRWWVHPILQLREKFGAFNRLFFDLRKDQARFVELYRVTPAQFDTSLTACATD